MKEPISEKTAIQAVDAVFSAAEVTFEVCPFSEERGFDAEIVLIDSGRRLCLEYHPAISLAQFDTVARRLITALPKGAQGGLIVRRVGLTLLDACKKHGLCVFSLDGNGYVRLPGVYVERYRPAAETKRMPSAGTCFTAKASRLLRALFDRYPHDSTQADLARKTGLSRGYVSILVGRLVEDGYVSNHFDQLYLEAPDRLLDAWAMHYRFDRHARSHWALMMNTYEEGLEKLAAALRAQGVSYAFTGWSGAYLRAPYALPDTLMAYVDKVPSSCEGVYRSAKQGNVLLLVPQDAGVFQFAANSNFGAVVCDPQLYVDLCRMPGRAREQADALRHDWLRFERKSDER